jgi:hypothetical protein|tara:strand:- start:454 stop:1185 length:732 start_codon:yes stop_codon:yes gene_type:complete
MQKNLYKGKQSRCFILATGPSTSQVDLSLLQDEITIGVNDIQKSNFTPDYIVVSDAETLERERNYIFLTNKKIKHFIFGESPDNRLGPETINKINHPQFSKICRIVSHKEQKEEWYTHMPSMHERTIDIAKQRYFIDDKLETFSVYGGSVVQDLAIPTAVYLGFKEIYLIGVDGGFRHFYANDFGENNSVGKWVGRYGETRPAHNFTAVKELLNSNSINIYNCSPTNNFKELKYKLLTEVLKK